MHTPVKSMLPPTVEEWARSFDISTDPTPPTVEDYDEPCLFTARQIAVRAIILQGVVAAAFDVDPEPIVEWFKDQGIWDSVSPKEKSFLLASTVSDNEVNKYRWCNEAEWALLWMVGKVESLGLPNHQCDTARLVDEIMPELGSDIEPFLASAKLGYMPTKSSLVRSLNSMLSVEVSSPPKTRCSSCCLARAPRGR